MGEYTRLTLAAIAGVVALELLFWRTGIWRTARFWLAMGIGLGFQIPVDGWLTRAGAQIVSYRDSVICGIRWPWNIPIEDFGFGFALLSFSILSWAKLAAPKRDGADV